MRRLFFIWGLPSILVIISTFLLIFGYLLQIPLTNSFIVTLCFSIVGQIALLYSIISAILIVKRRDIVDFNKGDSTITSYTYTETSTGGEITPNYSSDSPLIEFIFFVFLYSFLVFGFGWLVFIIKSIELKKKKNKQRRVH